MLVERLGGWRQWAVGGLEWCVVVGCGGWVGADWLVVVVVAWCWGAGVLKLVVIWCVRDGGIGDECVLCVGGVGSEVGGGWPNVKGHRVSGRCGLGVVSGVDFHLGWCGVRWWVGWYWWWLW